MILRGLTTDGNRSVAELIALLPDSEREEILREIAPTPKAQEELLYDWHFWARPNQLPPPGNWFGWLLLAGRGFGKALNVKTPIPTPDGWKLMGELQPGDWVFNEKGEPVLVSAVSDVMYGHACYEVCFSDGSTIVADAEHEWVTYRPLYEKPMETAWTVRTVTTKQIKRDMYKVGRSHWIAEVPTPEGRILPMRYIVDVRPVPSVPVCCILVDTESHLFLAGKTFIPTHNSRSGSEFVIERAKQGMGPIALIGQTKSDVRDTMVELGPASIIKVSPPWFTPVYEVSKRRLVWPNGVTATIFSGDEPDQLRGPQHATAWVDEVAKFRFPVETMGNLEFGLRVGPKPQMVITTTPRPIPVIKEMVKDPDFVVTYGSSYENIGNLSERFIERVIGKYEGTRIGRQELHGVILDDTEGALWTHELIDQYRVDDAPRLKRVVVGVDPKVSEKASSECGIVVAGLGYDEHVYILADRSVNASHTVWSQAIVKAYHDFEADMVYGEINQGGDLVEAVIRSVDPNIPFETVRATRGKAVRAEPVANLYDKGRVHHVGLFPELEDQSCVWVPGEESPDRMDALCWAVWALVIKDQEPEKIARAKSR